MKILILFIILDFLLLLPIFIIPLSDNKHKKFYNRAIYYCLHKIGYLISINAPIRTGKSTFLSGLSHVLQVVIKQKLNNTMKKVKQIFYFIDFNDFDTILDEYFNDNIDIDIIVAYMVRKYKFIGDYLFYDYISFTTVYDLLYDYIDSYYIINFRDQYVYSKTPIYSHITNKMNLKYDLNWTKINDAYANKSYAIYNNFVELVDEATDELGASKIYDDVKDKGGGKEYRRKYGHIHKEKNYLITTKQDVTDEISRYRKLFQSNMEIASKVQVVGSFKLLNKSLKTIVNIPKKINYFRFNLMAMIKGNIYYDDRKTYIDYKMNGNVFGQKLEYIISYAQKYLFSKSYCKFNTNIYASVEDFGKENTKTRKYYDDITFIIPLKYCFGTFNTHEFNYIQNELIKNSDLTFTDLEIAMMFKNKDDVYFSNKLEKVESW